MIQQADDNPTRAAQEKWVYSACVGCMQSDCSIRVQVKDGVVTNIEGNPDKVPPGSGKICTKGISSIMSLYNPYRVKTPLKRTNPEKGPDIDPGWVEISWEEASTLWQNASRKSERRTLANWEYGGAGACHKPS